MEDNTNPEVIVETRLKKTRGRPKGVSNKKKKDSV